MKQSDQRKHTSAPKGVSEGPLTVTKSVLGPPEIEDTIAKARQALAQAKKAKSERRHVCRICEKPSCIHYERKYVDTGEEFENNGPDLDR
jgi:hypothetical protein